MRGKYTVIAVFSASLLVACEGAPPPIAGSGSPAKSKVQLAASSTSEAATPTRPHLELSEADFKEAEGARDPFRQQLDKPPPPDPRIKCDKGKLRKYGLDELKLTGIVGGGTRPLAMFRGPTSGTSTTVKRGDRIGKTCGQVKAILRDKVIVTIQLAGSDKRAERVIPLHTS